MVVHVYKLWLTGNIHDSDLTTNCFGHFKFGPGVLCCYQNPVLYSESRFRMEYFADVFSSKYAPGQITVDEGSDLRIMASAHRMLVDCEVLSSG